MISWKYLKSKQITNHVQLFNALDYLKLSYLKVQ